MSVTSYAFIEFRYPSDSNWVMAARLQLYGDVDVYRVLAWPWGPWDPKTDERPGPIVKPRGIPKDLSLQALHEYAWMVGKKEAGEYRILSPSEAKKRRCKPYRSGYVVDPREWRCSTWLTTTEVAKACGVYTTAQPHRRSSPELEGVRAMMQAIEMHGPTILHQGSTVARLVCWFD